MEENKESLQPQDDKREKAKVILLAVIAACLVTIVIQNFFPSEREVSGNMWLDGGYVSVNGGYVGVRGSVSVDNLSDISIISIPSSTHSYDYPWDMSPIDVRIVGSSEPLDVNIEKVNGRYVGRGIPVEVNN